MAILNAAAGSFPGASGIWWSWQAVQEVFRSSLNEKPEDEDAEGVFPP